MCGISVVISKININESYLQTFHSLIKHRGPDESYYYSKNDNSIKSSGLNKDKADRFFGAFLRNNSKTCYKSFFVGHHRYKIYCKGNSGIQPVVDQQNKFCLLFNGSIYNYKEICNKNKVSHSDTDVLFECLNENFEETLSTIDGPHAITYFNRQTQRIYICRDFFGEKPLFYFLDDNTFIVSSEINAIAYLCKRLNKTLSYNRKFLNSYIVKDRLPLNKYTLFKEISPFKSNLLYNFNYRNWKIEFSNIQDKYRQSTLYADYNYNELSDLLSNKIENSVLLKQNCDRPVGLFLSGGLDSNVILNFINAKKDNYIGEFNILEDGKETEYETDIARTSCLKYKRTLNTINVKFSINENLLESYSTNSDMPIHNPVFLLQDIGWRKFKELGGDVFLNGAGADEIFCGYQYYQNYFPLSKVNITSIKQLNFLKWLIKNILKRRLSYSNTNLGKIRLNDIFEERIPFWNYQIDKSSMSIPVEGRFPFLNKDLFAIMSNLNNLTLQMNYKNSKIIFRQLLRDRKFHDSVFRMEKRGFIRKENKDLVKLYNNYKSEILPIVSDHIEIPKKFDKWKILSIWLFIKKYQSL
ncbi:asparagine synthase-related protein [Verrucomicrobia bacterium]|nr:asparagine synthase-related protein [Verrucomicrobiota bacterium]